jgi:hypothetical protein
MYSLNTIKRKYFGILLLTGFSDHDNDILFLPQEYNVKKKKNGELEVALVRVSYSWVQDLSTGESSLPPLYYMRSIVCYECV